MLTGAARRRIFGDYQATEPSRFLDEIPAELVDRVEPAAPAPRWQPRVRAAKSRTAGAGRSTGASARPNRGPSAYESEDQSTPSACGPACACATGSSASARCCRRRGPRRRLQGHRAVQRGRNEEAARELRGAGAGVTSEAARRIDALRGQPAHPRQASSCRRPSRRLRLGQRRHRHEPVAFGQIHQPHALRVAADRAADRRPSCG